MNKSINTGTAIARFSLAVDRQTKDKGADFINIVVFNKQEGYKLNPLYIETKSKRLQLLIQPSLHEKLKSKAKAEGISVNELVNSILQNALAEE